MTLPSKKHNSLSGSTIPLTRLLLHSSNNRVQKQYSNEDSFLQSATIRKVIDKALKRANLCEAANGDHLKDIIFTPSIDRYISQSCSRPKQLGPSYIYFKSKSYIIRTHARLLHHQIGYFISLRMFVSLMPTYWTLRASGSALCGKMALVLPIFGSHTSWTDHFAWVMCICICVLKANEVRVIVCVIVL